ncbi:MAG: deoxyguanosinetriphosphate triphosphohydrolase [Planctomycetes bacterium]|nr:deoxyguanosinetriphosphate triphosphohydrolase [Planctomycetota bacterium]
MLTRVDIENREADILAPYAMKSRDSRGRKHPEKEHPFRLVYQRDRDRVIHSTAFRRLEYKTQVFLNHEGDHYRTRLTHTIEVAQIARTIARALNVNEDLVEAIALAHDIGHTPFGHSGEDALRELMKDHGGFEHNRHGLRVVDLLEVRYPEFRGLNLSYEVRESIAKHSTPHDAPDSTEFDLGERVLIEAQIVEVADAIAYDSHDVDDGLGARILRQEDLEGIGLWQRAAGWLKDANMDLRFKRAQTVRYIINLEVTDLIDNTRRRIEEMGIRSPKDVRRADCHVVCFSDEVRGLKEELEDFLSDRVYRHFHVTRMSRKAKRFLTRLFNAYVGDLGQLPDEHREWAERDDVGIHQGVCDYIAGMTDRYAQDDYVKLFYPYERV